MTRIEIILVVLVVGALIAALLARGGGPRVTQIDRTVRKEKDDDDA